MMAEQMGKSDLLLFNVRPLFLVKIMVGGLEKKYRICSFRNMSSRAAISQVKKHLFTLPKSESPLFQLNQI
jgi:hypothetical protein